MELRLLLGETKSKVFNYLAARKHTAGEMSEKLDIQLNAARKHLESLKSKGLVVEEYAALGVGRPKKFYGLTGKGRELIQNQGSETLNLFLAETVKKNGKQNTDEIMKQVAKEMAGSVPSGGSEKEEKQKLESLVSFLDKFGFESSLEEGEESCTIISRHCPLNEVALNHQKLVCNGLHGEIIKSALAIENVKLEECMALGDAVCRHVISK